MIIHNVPQGSPEWLSLRAKFNTASEAPAMMGASKYQTRAELLRAKATGYTPPVDAAKQRLFDRGHATEALARVLVEDMTGEEFYPVVGSEGNLLASFDGVTMGGEIGFEHKLHSESLAAQVRAGTLEAHYFWQLEQEILVGGLEKVIFVCSDGTPENFVHMEYRAVPGRAEQLLAGWRQFAIDLASYQHVEVLPAAVATVQPSLPAPVVRMDGALTVASNLPDFAVALRAYITNIPTAPSTDQEFADCDAACKALKKAEDALQQAEDGALAQMTDVEQMRRVVGDLRTLARTTRLASEKMVAARKEQIRVEIYQGGIKAYQDHVAGLNARLGRAYMPPLPVDFAGAIKNKRTVESLRDAISTHLATAKIAANDVADRIQINLATLVELASDHRALFPDTAQIVLKANDDLTALVKTRIADHERAEAARLERQRALIAEEERVKAEAKVRAEAARREKADREEADRAARELIHQPIVVPIVFPSVDAAAEPVDQPMPTVVDQSAVVPIRPVQGIPTMTNGKVCAILGFNVTADFLVSIGAPAPTKQANANLWHDRQILDIMEALGAHMSNVYAEQKAKYQPARTRTAA